MPALPFRPRASLLFLILPALGCADVLGLGQYGSGGAATGGATAGTAGSGGTTTGGTGGTSTGGIGGTGTGGTGGTSTGGAGGTGGTGGCVPRSMEACDYTGPPGTDGIGACKAATRTCDESGAWGPCAGEVLPAQELCTTQAVDENCDQIAKCSGQYRWARRFGGPGLQLPAAIAADPDGNVVVAGYADAPFEVDGVLLPHGGAEDLLVVKLDAGGKPLWARMLGDGALQAAAAVAADAAGNVVVAGRFAGSVDFGLGAMTAADGEDVFVAKLDPDGEELWHLALGSTGSDLANGVAVDDAGDVYVTGAYSGAPTIGADVLPASSDGSYSIYVAKIAGATGSPVWARGSGDIYHQIGKAIAVGGGSVYLAADAAGAVTFDGGLSYLPEGGGGDIVLAKLSADSGAYEWGMRWGDVSEQLVTGVAYAKDAGLLLAGHLRGTFQIGAVQTMGDATLDAAVWKLKADGTTQWVVRAASAGDQYAFGLATDASGFTVAAGTFEGTIDFLGDPLTATTTFDRFFVKQGPGGGNWWSRSFPNGAGSVTRLAIDGLGRVDFAAGLHGATDFGGGTLASSGPGDADIVIGQFAP